MAGVVARGRRRGRDTRPLAKGTAAWMQDARAATIPKLRRLGGRGRGRTVEPWGQKSRLLGFANNAAGGARGGPEQLEIRKFA